MAARRASMNLRATVFANHFMPVLAYNRGCARKAGTTAQADLARRLAGQADGFPPMVRKRLGFALYQAQIGQSNESAKMLQGFTETVWQVRADDPSGTYRAVYRRRNPARRSVPKALSARPGSKQRHTDSLRREARQWSSLQKTQISRLATACKRGTRAGVPRTPDAGQCETRGA